MLLLLVFKSVLEGMEEGKYIKRYVFLKEKLEGKFKLLSEWKLFKLCFGGSEIDSFENVFLWLYY